MLCLNVQFTFVWGHKVSLCLSAILDSSVESSLVRSVPQFFLLDICFVDVKFLEFFVYFGD